MSSSKTFMTSSLYVLSFAFLLQTVFGADPLFHFCSSSENFTTNSPYETNLNKLLGDLYFKAPPTGFGAGSVGQNQYKANGLALCRGDVSNTDCKSCVTEAGSKIRKRCPYNKGAIIWYDYCLLKYSNTDFFGKIDNQNKFYLYNVNNVSDPESFNQKTKKLLSQLSEEAYDSSKMYATGESELGDFKKLYGLVQCTRDLSSTDCKKCLDSAISELPSCCDGKEGGRVVGGSCNFRYEIYPFVNA
ncbi:cysteine-rich repeat secretory protein 38-like [Cornus florida]|uniref:cysteine-rich repeat secretory protein 38-like n=1 Tax=Cornus florida TaxID=4283 RepID=UPI0028969BA7|nr:cysteine-rich repeat secretory protein 38-like [Cornus florida]